MIENDFSIEVVGKEHFFFQNFAESVDFLGGDNFHPFFKAFPLPKQNEEVVFTNLIEGLDFFEPLFDWDELGWFGVDELADSFAAEGVVVLNLFVYYLRVWDDLHVIMVVLIFADHVNKFVRC